MQMSDELSQLRSLCKNILALMSNYASRSPKLDHSSISAVHVPSEGKSLELLPAKHALLTEHAVGAVHVGAADSATPCETAETEAPKLFGVSIGMKRRRVESEGERERDEQSQTQTQSSQEPDRWSDMKSEPLDGDDSDDQVQEPRVMELGK